MPTRSCGRLGHSHHRSAARTAAIRTPKRPSFRRMVHFREAVLRKIWRRLPPDGPQRPVQPRRAGARQVYHFPMSDPSVLVEVDVGGPVVAKKIRFAKITHAIYRPLRGYLERMLRKSRYF